MRKQLFTELQSLVSTTPLNLKLKYRELKKDPLIIAIAALPEGFISFEYVPEAALPWGAFLVHNLGAVDTLSDGLVEHREVETVFLSFGFHSEPILLLDQIQEFLSKLEILCQLIVVEKSS